VIPLRDENPTAHFPVVTVALIALNVMAFLLWEPTLGQHTEAQQETFFFCHAVIPYEVIHHTSLGQSGPAGERAIAAGFHESLADARRDQEILARRCGQKSWLFSIFEAMFLHAGWLHIGGNMLFLWVFGNNVEDKLRAFPYLLFYLASGVVATAVQIALVHAGTNALLPNLGASGAIAGVLGAYLLMFPRRRVLTVVIFFLITVVYIPAYVVLGAWFVLQFFDGVMAISHSVNAGGGVAVWAHVGGFAFGLLLAALFFPKERFGARPPPRRPDPRGRRWLGRRAAGRPYGGSGRAYGSGPYAGPELPWRDPREPPPRPDLPG
jgi:membrane associated rhomboid family serine protease